MAAYSAGTLEPGQELLLSCQTDMQPDVARRVVGFDAIGGAVIEKAKGESVSDAFLGNVFSALDDLPQEAAIEAAPAPMRERERWMPPVLDKFLNQADIKVKWRKAGPGIEHASLAKTKSGERLYLLRASPGTKMPVHSHAGEEWTLILQGGYHVGETGYARGDLHWENSDCEHQPVIDNDGEDCISLVFDQGRLKFKNPLLSLFQYLSGV